MKKRLSIFVAGAFALILGLSACNKSNNNNQSSDNDEPTYTPTPVHQHTYSEDWQCDDHQHWHESTCEHTGLKKDIADHSMKETVVPPTYSTNGYTVYKCTVCGYSYTGNWTTALQHKYSSNWSYDENGHWHACTDSGYEFMKKDEESHDFKTSSVSATYEHGGYTTYTCKKCGYSYQGDQTDPIPHQYSSEWSHDEHSHWHGCTDSGYEDLKSSESSHNFEENVVTATYEHGGYIEHTCHDCGYSYFDNETDPLPHHYASAWSSNQNGHFHLCTDDGYEELTSNPIPHEFESVVTPATHDQGGSTFFTCKVCGYSYTGDYTNQIPYSITWKNWDGEVLGVTECLKGQVPAFSETPTKAKNNEYYYEFTGWSPEVVVASDDATYIAQFTQHERTSFDVKYNANGGSGAPSAQTKTNGSALTLSSTKPTKDDYVFVGWNNIYENTIYSSGSQFNLDKDVTLWAMWESKCSNCSGKGTITSTSSCSHCYGNGKVCASCGSASTTLQYQSNGTFKTVCASCGSASRKTCSWCSGKGSSTSTYSCSSCNGTGHLTGSAPTTSSVSARSVTLKTVSGYEYSKDKTNWQSSTVFEGLAPSTSYTFYQRRATKDDVPFGPISKGLTVTTYSSTLFYVTYDLDGGTNNSSNPSTYYSSSSSNITLANPTKDHYDFAGWTYNGSKVTAIQPSWAVDITLVATWTAHGYTISYELNGGTNNSSNPSSHTVNSSEITLADPTRTGYTFTGWTGSNGDTPEKDVKIEAGNTQNLSYTANWSLNTYYVSYELNGGTNNENNPSSFTVEDGYVYLKNPTKDHYDFAGWKENGSSISYFNPNSPSDHSVEATWTPHNYSITYDYAEGSGSNPTTHNIESDDITLTDPTRNGYTFTGWTGSNGDTPDTNVTIEAGNTEELNYTANWSLNTYDITYHLDGGTNHVKNPSSYTILDTITLKDASKDYYNFAGWYTEPEFVNKITALNGRYGDLDLYAKFIPFNFNSSFNSNGGVLSYTVNLIIDSSTTQTHTLLVGDHFDLYSATLPTYSYKVFAGWYLDSSCTEPFPDDYLLKSDITLYAKWIDRTNGSSSELKYGSSKTVAINGRSSGGSSTSYFYVPYNSNGAFRVTATTKYYNTSTSTYHMYNADAYWYLSDVTANKTICSSSSSYTKEVQLELGHYYKMYAYGEYNKASSNSSIYSASDCSLKVENIGIKTCDLYNDGFVQSYECDSIMPSTCRKDGYDFTGWYDENDELIHSTWDYTSDQTFYAGWAIHEYSINYVLNGGTNNENNPSSYTINDTINLSNPTREGYTFGGWYSDSGFTSQMTKITGSACKDYTLYAKWTANNYTATLDYDGGELCPVVNYYSNGVLIKSVDAFNGSTIDYFVPEAPSANLKFAGWYYNSSFTSKLTSNASVTSDTNLYAKWVDIGDYEYRELGSNFNVAINGTSYQYYAIVSPITQTVTIHSESELDLYGAVYNSSWGVVASNDDISDDDLDFSMTVTLQAGNVYYIACKGNQVSTVGDCLIVVTGTNSISPQLTGVAFTKVETVAVTFDKAYSLPTPKKDGYVFVGWFDEFGNPVDVTSWNYASNITIYAHWIPAE